MKEEFKRRLLDYAKNKKVRKLVPWLFLLILFIILVVQKVSNLFSYTWVCIAALLVLVYLVFSRALDVIAKSSQNMLRKNKWRVLIFSDDSFVSDFCIFFIILPLLLIIAHYLPESIFLQIIMMIGLIILAFILDLFLTNLICKFARKWIIEDEDINQK